MLQNKLVFSEKAKLRAFFKKYADGIYRNAIVEFIPDTGGYFIGIGSDVKSFTHRAKAMLERRLFKDLQINSTIMQFAAPANEAVVEALVSMLEIALPSNFADASVSFSQRDSADVVVFVKNGMPDETESLFKATKKKTADLLASFSVTLTNIYFHELANEMPSLFQILRKIYILSPVPLDILQSALTESDTFSPSDRWLKRQIDALQKKHLLLWDNGHYTLTSAGIAMLPSITGKNSPDIARSLELSRRRW